MGARAHDSDANLSRRCQGHFGFRGRSAKPRGPRKDSGKDRGFEGIYRHAGHGKQVADARESSFGVAGGCFPAGPKPPHPALVFTRAGTSCLPRPDRRCLPRRIHQRRRSVGTRVAAGSPPSGAPGREPDKNATRRTAAGNTVPVHARADCIDHGPIDDRTLRQARRCDAGDQGHFGRPKVLRVCRRRRKRPRGHGDCQDLRSHLSEPMADCRPQA